MAGLTPLELFDASPVVHELERIIVGSDGNSEFSNLPRKFNIVVTGCTDNCTHSESQDSALVPARQPGRLGFTGLVSGTIGSAGFAVPPALPPFLETLPAAPPPVLPPTTYPNP